MRTFISIFAILFLTVSAHADTSIKGKVSMGAALAAKTAPEDTVFIFARAAQGPRIPLAVARIKVKDLPYRYTLDESMAMSPQMTLAQFPEVKIFARVSKAGEATPRSGDLEGSSAVIKTGSKDVNVVINTVMP